MHRQQQQTAELNPQREVAEEETVIALTIRAGRRRPRRGRKERGIGRRRLLLLSPACCPASCSVGVVVVEGGGGAVVVFVRGSRVEWTRASPPRHLFGRKAATDRGPTSQCLPLVLLDQPHDESLLVGY